MQSATRATSPTHPALLVPASASEPLDDTDCQRLGRILAEVSLSISGLTIPLPRILRELEVDVQNLNEEIFRSQEVDQRPGYKGPQRKAVFMIRNKAREILEDGYMKTITEHEGTLGDRTALATQLKRLLRFASYLQEQHDNPLLREGAHAGGSFLDMVFIKTEQTTGDIEVTASR